jgi:hypothetical protein
VLALKREGMYDMHVDQHRRALQELHSSPAHRGPALFPWHRECLWRFELDLQAMYPRVTLPYWDWTRDREAPSPIFQADFLGSNGDASDLQVMDGSFAYSTSNWTLTINDDSSTPLYLRRSIGTLEASLPTAAWMNSALNMAPLRRRTMGRHGQIRPEGKGGVKHPQPGAQLGGGHDDPGNEPQRPLALVAPVQSRPAVGDVAASQPRRELCAQAPRAGGAQPKRSHVALVERGEPTDSQAGSGSRRPRLRVRRRSQLTLGE